MEHVVQVGVNIDDAALQKAVENSVVKEVTREIMDNVEMVLPHRYSSFKSDSNAPDYEKFAKDIVEDMFSSEEFKARVVDRAAEMLVEQVKRTKAWREKYKEVAGL